MHTACHGEAESELFNSAIVETFGHIEDGIVEELRATARLDRSVIHRLRRMLLARILYRFDRTRLLRLESAAYPRLPGRLADEISLFAQVLNEGMEAGSLAVENPRSMARTLMLATDSLLPSSALALKFDRRDDLEQKASELIDLLLDGLVQRDWLADPPLVKAVRSAG